MRKKQLFFVFAVFLIVFTLTVISAESCCIQPKPEIEGWCVDNVLEEDCVSGWANTECKAYTPCNLGTCVTKLTGECSSTIKTECVKDGGDWYPEQDENQVIVEGLKVCKKGCCSYGPNKVFLNYAQCMALSLRIGGAPTIFNGGITERSECLSLAGGDEEVACVLTDLGYRDCRRITYEECNSKGGTPHPGFLCTASELATVCSKTINTRCEKDKVYFTDTCGNLANIYYEDMFTIDPDKEWTLEMINYWTKIVKPKDSCDLEEYPDSSCGNCEIATRSSTICRSHKEAKENIPEGGTEIDAPKFGKYVCATMDCYYDVDEKDTAEGKELFAHGETWCAQSEGVLSGIERPKEDGNGKTVFEARSNLSEFVLDSSGEFNANYGQNFYDDQYSKYNLPGSRYYVLGCSNGEVVVDPCEDYRLEICMQSKTTLDLGKFIGERDYHLNARCYKNNWKACAGKTTFDTCEQSIFCKWVFGYRESYIDEQTTIQTRNPKAQGSCLPLFAPGINTWDASNKDDRMPNSSVCSSASLVDAAVYQNSIWRSRDEFKDRLLCVVEEGKGRQNDPTTDCMDNCYLIPTYGRQNGPTADYFNVSILDFVHKGGLIWPRDKFEEYCISDRKTYYCGDKAGEVNGENVLCAKDESKRRNLPVFFTHEEFINALKEKTRSSGDCGYKKDIYSDTLASSNIDKNLESIWVVFKKIKQKGSYKEDYETEKVYEGDFEYVGGRI